MQQEIQAGLGQREAGFGGIGLLRGLGQPRNETRQRRHQFGACDRQNSIGSRRWEPRWRNSVPVAGRAWNAEPQPAPDLWRRHQQLADAVVRQAGRASASTIRWRLWAM